MRTRIKMMIGCLAVSFSMGIAGCPLPDSDGDGLPDLVDPCPNNPDLSCQPAPEPATCWDCDNPPAKTGRLLFVRDPVPDAYIVVLETPKSEVKAVHPATFASKVAGLSNVQSFSRALYGFSATVKDKASLTRLLQDDGVRYVTQVGRKTIPKPKPSSSASASVSWALDRIDQVDLPLSKSYSPAQDGAGTAVYVIDTGCPSKDLKGCRQDHPEFGPRLQYESFSTVVYQGVFDAHGHGTFCQSEIAGLRFGVAKAAKVYSCRFLDAQGSGDDAGGIRCIDWVIANDPGPGVRKVMSNSWGGGPSAAINEAICRARAAGIFVSNAAGNETQESCLGSPAQVSSTATVGASGSSDTFAYFSSFGPNVDLVAPGVDVEGATPTGGSTTMSGTSMATPIVAGAAALAFQRHPAFSPDQILSLLIEEATKDKLKSIPADTPNRLVHVQPK